MSRKKKINPQAQLSGIKKRKGYVSNRMRSREGIKINRKINKLKRRLEVLLDGAPEVELDGRMFKVNPLEAQEYKTIVREIYKWRGQLQDLGEWTGNVGRDMKDIVGVHVDADGNIPQIKNTWNKTRFNPDGSRVPMIQLADRETGAANIANRKLNVIQQTPKNSPNYKAIRKVLFQGLDRRAIEGHHIMMLQLYAPWFKNLNEEDSLKLAEHLISTGNWSGDVDDNFAFLYRMAHQGGDNSVHRLMERFGIFAKESAKEPLWKKGFLDELAAAPIERRIPLLDVYTEFVQGSMPEIFATAIADNPIVEEGGRIGLKGQRAIPKHLGDKIVQTVDKFAEGVAGDVMIKSQRHGGEVMSMGELVGRHADEVKDIATSFNFQPAKNLFNALGKTNTAPGLIGNQWASLPDAAVTTFPTEPNLVDDLLDSASKNLDTLTHLGEGAVEGFKQTDLWKIGETGRELNYSNLKALTKPGTTLARRGMAILPFVGAAADAWDVTERWKEVRDNPNEGLADWMDKFQFGLATGTAATTWWAEPVNMAGGLLNLGIDAARTAIEEEKRSEFLETMEHIGNLGRGTTTSVVKSVKHLW